MPRETFLTAAVARVAGVPFTLSRRRPFHTPHKALILQPCCLSQVLLATPLLAALGQSFPEARFDWAVGEWSRLAVAGNRRLTELVLLGEEDLHQLSWRQIGQLIGRLQGEHYDTVFIPNSSSLLSYIAWQARIEQRVGLNLDGRGFAHTIPVSPPPEMTNAGERGLLLAAAVGVAEETLGRVNMEFHPSDRDRTAVTRLLIEELDWLGDVPLVIMHPGGGVNPVKSQPLTRWPAERFALLANHLTRAYKARVLLVGNANEKAITAEIAGMIAGGAANYAGRLSLGELGALCEVADLYVGNDSGPTHIAAESGCRTLAIYGPSNPAYSRPYSTRDNVQVLWRDLSALEAGRPFSWDVGVTVEEAQTAVDELLNQLHQRENALSLLTGNSVSATE
jgi:ADP-heptose:LPS heptosyltransferase